LNGFGFRLVKNLTAPLTFILSRKGREELKEYPPHPDPLPRGGEGKVKMERFKQCPSP